MRSSTLIRAGGIAVAVTLASLGGIVKAEASSPPGLVGWYDLVGTHGSAGTMLLNGQRVLCVQDNFQDPSALAGPYSTITDHPHIAYAISKYLNTPSNDVAAALWAYANIDGMSPDGSSIQQSGPGQATQAQLAANLAYLEGLHAGIAPALAAIKADAAANAGPYDSSSFAMTLTGSKSAGVVSSYGVQSASGAWQPGLNGTITLAGPAVWDATGTATMSFTTTASAQSAAWHATGTGTVDAQRSVINGLPGMGGIEVDATTNLPQLVAVSAAPGSDPAQKSVSVAVYVPKLTTKVSSQLAGITTPVHDSVVASGGEPGATWSGTVDVYTCLTGAPKDGIPSTAVPTTTLKVSGVFGADGTSTVDTADVTLSCGGYAYFWEHLAATSSTPAFDAPKGTEITETTLVIGADLKTAINQQTSNVGDTIVDKVDAGTLPATDVLGNPITYTVSGVIVKAPTCSGTFDVAKPVFTFGPVPYVAGATYGSFTVPASVTGCLSYVETLAWSSPSGSGSVSHAPGLASESTSVAKIRGAAGGAEISTGLPVMTGGVDGAQRLLGLEAISVALILGSAMFVLRRTERKAGQQA